MSETNSAAPAATDGTHVATAQEAHELLREVVQGRRLTREQASTVFAALGAGDLSEVETAALLAALHARGEEPQEVAGAQGGEDRGGLLTAQAPSLNHLSQQLVRLLCRGSMRAARSGGGRAVGLTHRSVAPYAGG